MVHIHFPIFNPIRRCIGEMGFSINYHSAVSDFLEAGKIQPFLSSDLYKGRPYKCPYCGSTQTHWKGYRARADGGVARIRKCNGCKRKFTTRRVVEVTGAGEPED